MPTNLSSAGTDVKQDMAYNLGQHYHGWYGMDNKSDCTGVR
jgi:hypothetical protein